MREGVGEVELFGTDCGRTSGGKECNGPVGAEGESADVDGALRSSVMEGDGFAGSGACSGRAPGAHAW